MFIMQNWKNTDRRISFKHNTVAKCDDDFIYFQILRTKLIFAYHDNIYYVNIPLQYKINKPMSYFRR